jgi:enoyl-CoA hydratase/carnithine racemase
MSETPPIAPISDERAVLVSVDQGVMTIALNRPAARNAVTPRMVLDMVAALDAADSDDHVRAVLFTGIGDAYSVGADLSGGGATFRSSARAVQGDRRDLGGVLALRMFASVKPVIGAVNGVAAGLGATMLLPMDIRIASTSSRFGFVFTRRGIVPEACSSWFLPRLVGISRALEWTISGRVFGPEEALQAGLLRSLHEPAELLDAARTIAAELTGSSAPVSMAAARQLMWRGLSVHHPEQAHRAESGLLQRFGAGPDAVEGITAFLEKRDPVFPGRLSERLTELRACLADPDQATAPT